MKISRFTIMSSALAMALVAAAAHAAASTQDFVQKVSVANEFEIESSKLALDKSQNKQIKAFAQRMVDDHTKAGDDFNIALQSSPSGQEAASELDSKHQKMMDKLQSLSGDDFNNEYIKMQTSAHKDAVSLFTDYSKHGDDPALKRFASATLPTLKQHLQHVKDLKTS